MEEAKRPLPEGWRWVRLSGAALRVIGNPADVLRQTKERIFAA